MDTKDDDWGDDTDGFEIPAVTAWDTPQSALEHQIYELKQKNKILQDEFKLYMEAQNAKIENLKQQKYDMTHKYDGLKSQYDALLQETNEKRRHMESDELKSLQNLCEGLQIENVKLSREINGLKGITSDSTQFEQLKQTCAELEKRNREIVGQSHMLATLKQNGSCKIRKIIKDFKQVELQHPEPIDKKITIWEWEDDDGYKTFPSYISRYINNSSGVITISILQGTEHILYDIDTTKLTQRSRKTDNVRKIRSRQIMGQEKRYNTQLILGNNVPKSWLSQTIFMICPNISDTDSDYAEMKLWTATHIKANIISIQRVQCPFRLNRFLTWVDVQETPNIRKMLHGTFAYPPDAILEEPDGLDYRMSGADKYLGFGTYFTPDFEYVQNYAYKTAKYRQVIICEVALGKCAHIGTKRTPECRKAPDNYHSVSGSSSGRTTDIFCVYNNDQVYPSYIVTYEI